MNHNPNHNAKQHQDNPGGNKALSGIRQTRPRRLVMAVLETAEQPLSAVEIQLRMEKTGEKVWLSTVYRILDLLVDRGIVLKSTLLDQDMAVYGLNRYEHKHFAVCVDCHKIIAMENCPMTDFQPGIKDSNFHVIGHKIEIYGYCRDCSKNRRH